MIPLRDDIPHRRAPLVTWLLVAANTGVFLWQLTGSSRLDRLAAVPQQISQGHALYTVFTSMFMHGGFFHLLSNMWFLYIFGDNVEDALGHLGFLVAYLAAGVCGAGLQIAMNPGSRIPMVGASGAISGVLGSYMVLYPGARILSLLPIFYFLQFVQIPAVLFLGVWIAIQLLNGFATPRTGGGIAFFAHIGGFAFGFLIGIIIRVTRRRRAVRYSVY